jgi:hypothetical protein
MAQHAKQTSSSGERTSSAPFSPDSHIEGLRTRSPLIRILRSKNTLMVATLTAIALVVAGLLVALTLLR